MAYLYKGDEPDLLKYVLRNPANIKNIEFPSESLQLASASHNSSSIRFIKKPSKDVIWKSLQKNSRAIKYVSEPTTEMLNYAANDGNISCVLKLKKEYIEDWIELTIEEAPMLFKDYLNERDSYQFSMYQLHRIIQTYTFDRNLNIPNFDVVWATKDIKDFLNPTHDELQKFKDSLSVLDLLDYVTNTSLSSQVQPIIYLLYAT